MYYYGQGVEQDYQHAAFWLLKAAKQAALEQNITLTRLIEEALQEKLSGPHRPPRERSFQLVTVGGQGLQPGVDLDDSAALLEAMES